MVRGRASRLAVVATTVLVAVVTSLVGGCGSDGDGEGLAESARGTPAPDVLVSSSVPEEVTSTTALPPLAPWQVLVAVVRPEITRLETFDSPGGQPVEHEVAPVNPWYFGGELALLVEEGRETDEWLRVGIATRPNGTTAWIRRSDVTIRSHRMHAEVSLGERMLRLWDADTLLVETPVVIGTASTPTPPGRYFVNARIRRDNPGGAYGPWILSLSGFSEALETFDGGLPQLAIHGTNRPQYMGSARSNGCIRVENSVIERLAELTPLGTPVSVVP
jgi:hypothetical protein